MQISKQTLLELGHQLMAERKRQGLSREQAASVCNVSASFIRDAESDPARCTLERLLQLTQGLGLTMTLSDWKTGKELEVSQAPRSVSS